MAEHWAEPKDDCWAGMWVFPRAAKREEQWASSWAAHWAEQRAWRRAEPKVARLVESTAAQWEDWKADTWEDQRAGWTAVPRDDLKVAPWDRNWAECWAG